MPLLIRRFLTAVLLLSMALPALAQAPAGTTARLMSRVMFAGIVTGAESSAAKGKGAPGVLACLRAIDPLSLEPSYGRLLATAFTEDELAQLDAYYASPIGQLDFRDSVQTLRKSEGLPVDDPVTLTPAQQAARDAFLSSDISQRLGRVLSNDPPSDAMESLVADLMKVLEPCRPRS